jgi:hypothetical protein
MSTIVHCCGSSEVGESGTLASFLTHWKVAEGTDIVFLIYPKQLLVLNALLLMTNKLSRSNSNLLIKHYFN